MRQGQWELQKYVTPKGACPFDEWFADLDAQTQARIDARLDRVSLGNFGDRKSIGEGVYELRFFFGPGYRVYYGLAGRQVVLLLVGGDKKGQNKDIQTAQQLWATYKDEQREGSVMPVKDYRTDLLVRLANPDYAALYLKTALDETLKDGDREAFVLALRNVVEARQITQESSTDGSSKPLQRVLAEGENPTLETFVAVLSAVGLTIDFKPA